MSVPAEGGTQSVTYTITDPVEGAKISATSSETWIDGFNCETEGTITFEVAANEQTERRSSVLTVLYTYADGEVQAQMNIIQEAAIAYDYEYDLDVFTGTYYGSQFGVNGEHNWYTWISDKEFADGYTQLGGTYYLFDIFGPAPEDSSNPRPPAGTYTLGQAGATAEMTFTPDYSKGLSSTADGEAIFDANVSDGILNISYEGDNMHIDATLTLADGTTHHVTYSGPGTYSDDSDDSDDPSGGGLTEDLDIDARTAVASYAADDGGGVMEITIQLTDMDVDAEGYVTPPGSILTIDAVMPYDEEGNIATGEYTMSTDLSAYTVYPGELFWGLFPMGTYVTNYPDAETYVEGYLTEGTMEISGNSDNLTIECNFATADGVSVTASYTGPLMVSNMPGPFSTLTGDYTLNLEGATATATFYGDYYGTGGGNWYMTIMPTTGPDGFQADFVSSGTNFIDGITPGTYTASASNYPNPGEYLVGYMDGTSLGGTMYLGGFDDQGYVTQFAPAMSGTMEITKNSDGTYRFVLDFVDDFGNNWDGEWEGTVTTSDNSSAPRPAGLGVLAPVDKVISDQARSDHFSNLPIKARKVESSVRYSVGK